jgi:MoaA/NifB/PqqE/SkfB family radical SAM enzyme
MLQSATNTTPTPLRVPKKTPPGSLPEFKRYKPRVGHPDWPRLAREAKEAAAELRPRLKKPEGGIRNHLRRASAVKTTASNYLINRKRARAGREDLLPLYFVWTMLRTCNFECSYCCDHQGSKYPDLPNQGVLDTQQAKQLLKVMRTRTPSVYFAGGEPTLRKDLPELTQEAHDLNYYPIIINTNGSTLDRVLKKKEWENWLAQMDIIIVSLDALDLDTLGKMWVYKQPEQVIRNLLMLRELSAEMGFRLMVNTVIQPGNVQHAKDALDFANDMGIYVCSVPMNEGAVINDELAIDPEYTRFGETLLERKREGLPISGSLRLNQRLFSSAPLNCRNTVKPHIDFDGTLVWPCKAAVNVKPEYVNVLDFDNVDDLYAHASSVVDPTRFHGPAKNQCGGNCNWAQNYSTDAYVDGMLHPTHLVGEVIDFLKGTA